jgi:hypothetical protein
MGCWRGATFKEYIRKELACSSKGITTSMKWEFNFINNSGNAFNHKLIDCEYEINVSNVVAA